jgi:hypothetical protein
MAEPITDVNLTPASSGSILERLGLTPEGIMSGPNVQTTLTQPATGSDVLGIFQAQEEAAGVPQLREQFQQAQDIARREQLTIEGRRKKMGVLRGEQEQAAKLAQTDLALLNQALTSAEATASQRANILYNEYQQKVNLSLQYPGLKINALEDDWGKVQKKLKEYKEDEESRKYKQSLKKQLIDMGSSVKGLSTNELERKLRKKNKSALEDAQQMRDLEIRRLEADINRTNQLASGGSKKEEEISTDEVGSFIYESANTYGDSRQKIEADLRAQNVPVYKGSEADRLLNEQFPEEGDIASLLADEDESFWDKLIFWK